MGKLFGNKKQRSTKAATSGISLTRFIGPGLSGAGIFGILIAALTGQINLSSVDILRGTSGEGSGVSATEVRPVDLKQFSQKPRDTIRIATFNIQRFGDKKAENGPVMDALAKVMAQFDVIAIQEIQSADMTPIRVLVDLINGSGGQYAATVSERLGRDTYTESYAFVWDESRIRLAADAYVVQDPSERMPREPMVASFEARAGTAAGRRPFRFTLINVHTSPDGVSNTALENEMDVLDDVFIRVREYDYGVSGEEDCILLGDLNVDAGNLRELGMIPGILTIAGNLKTNTRRSKTYDHIVMDQNVTREYTGQFGVLDLQTFLGISEDQALMVSDHLPVWAEFSAYEAPPANDSPTNSVAAEPQIVR